MFYSMTAPHSRWRLRLAVALLLLFVPGPLQPGSAMLCPQHKLVYFAYPKCASSLVRDQLRLCHSEKWDNTYVENDWDAGEPRSLGDR